MTIAELAQHIDLTASMLIREADDLDTTDHPRRAIRDPDRSGG